MANKCDKCGGTGYIKQFSGIENGTCFRCEGTGVRLTAAEKVEIHRKRAEKHDARMAKEQGVSLETFRAYVAPWLYGAEIPKHPNGCSFSIQEFEAWRAAA